MIIFNNNPTLSTRITSSYGYRIHPITKKRQFHNGIDIGKQTKDNEPINAVANGYIIEQGYSKQRGNYVVIQHQGFATLYQHLSQYITKTDQIILSGQVIGYMGTSGSSTGIHLHFELFEDRYSQNKNINPEKYIRKE